jgi:hypothetical protein
METVFFFAGMTVLIGIVLFQRHQKAEFLHKERMAAMEKGMPLPVFEAPRAGMDPNRRNLLYGMIWLFSGAGLAVFLFALSATAPHAVPTPLAERQARIESLQKLGASNEELRQVINEQARQEREVPMGLGAVGFVPIGVGLAYLIFYATERKRYEGIGAQ